MKEFESKRNRVRLEGEVIKKTFSTTMGYQKEKAMLEKLASTCCPRLIGWDCCDAESRYELEMEYIEGQLLIDRYFDCENSEVKALAVALCKTITQIREVLGNQILVDENFRNYIVVGENIVRIDFEQAEEGELKDWIAKLVSFCLLYDVSDEKKIDFAKTVVDNFNLMSEAMILQIAEELKFLSKRWGVCYPLELLNKLK